jgi:transcriptional regulator with XRE-family HTH domain
MDKSKAEFARRLRLAMEAAGYEAKPAVLEREFNQRYWGRAVTLHGVRRWLLGETFPAHDKLLTLAEWLRVQPEELRDGKEIAQRIQQQRKRWDQGIGYQEREVFEAFLKLPVAQRKVVREVILAFVKACETGSGK